jgi:hypothetical protein
MSIKPNFTPEDQEIKSFDDTPVKPGTYVMEIFRMDLARSKDDSKTFLHLGLKHTGETKGPAVWDFISVDGTTQKGTAVSLKKLYSLVESLDLPLDAEIDAPGSDSLTPGTRLEGAHFIVNGDCVSPVGKQVKIKLAVEESEQYGDKNVTQFNYSSAE